MDATRRSTARIVSFSVELRTRARCFNSEVLWGMGEAGEMDPQPVPRGQREERHATERASPPQLSARLRLGRDENNLHRKGQEVL